MNTHKTLGEIYRTHEWLDDTRVWRCALLFNKLAFGVSFPTGSVKYTISGTVYDADGTTAVANATVALGAYNATSAANGTYTISNIPAGTSGSMTCTLSGYSWTAKTISAMSGNLTAQNYSNAFWAAGGCGASCVAAWLPKGADSYAASKTDVATGTYTASNGTAYPTWDATNGWKFLRTSSQYLTTSLAASTNQTWSMIIKFSNSTVASTYQCLAGCTDNSPTAHFGLYNEYNSNLYGYANGGQTRNPSGVLSAGRMEMCGKNCYCNGVSDGTISSGVVDATYPFYIGCRFLDGSGAQIFTTAYIQALAVFNADVSAYIASLDAGLTAV